MNTLVTGVAGFVGSSIADALLADGHRVVGVDSFTPYYSRSDKEANIANARASERFEFVEADLRTCAIEPLLENVSAVFHQAAQAGVRLSWSEHFAEYEGHNVLATQRILEAAKRVGAARIVFASSSSVYGNAARYPTHEEDLPRPHSPYGVTKLAGEHLCRLYAENWGVPTVSLRYFTVYGPRQRPDMACYRLLHSALTGEAFPLFGDGSAIRDFTFVGDIVRANLAAADADLAPGTMMNIAGGGSISVGDLIALAGEVVGRSVALRYHPDQAGDVRRTGGAIERAYEQLRWEPKVDIRAGLSEQAEWQRRRTPLTHNLTSASASDEADLRQPR